MKQVDLSTSIQNNLPLLKTDGRLFKTESCLHKKRWKPVLKKKVHVSKQTETFFKQQIV